MDASEKQKIKGKRELLHRRRSPTAISKPDQIVLMMTEVNHSQGNIAEKERMVEDVNSDEDDSDGKDHSHHGDKGCDRRFNTSKGGGIVDCMNVMVAKAVSSSDGNKCEDNATGFQQYEPGEGNPEQRLNEDNILLFKRSINTSSEDGPMMEEGMVEEVFTSDENNNEEDDVDGRLKAGDGRSDERDVTVRDHTKFADIYSTQEKVNFTTPTSNDYGCQDSPKSYHFPAHTLNDAAPHMHDTRNKEHGRLSSTQPTVNYNSNSLHDHASKKDVEITMDNHVIAAANLQVVEPSKTLEHPA
ncbi:hypothetical protein L2E82_35418 [Cichorium intybus]|uniref:Uncharacterized protein n=1 Tax=Cichorium intybus TaxID=13427 RepID=A0ACB9BNS6_CICIN|nr:hypothetical protein L2E82_35418 [Cichorium intybus]